MGDTDNSPEANRMPSQQLQHQEPQAVAGVPRLFVGQVPAEKQEEDLFPVFSPFGVIEKLSIVRGPDSKSRGCAMVEYKRWTDAEQAMATLHGNNPFEAGSGRPLVVHFANPRRTVPGQSNEQAIAPRKLFVGQIPKTSTEETVKELFGKYGTVEHVNMLKSRGVHAGCAFVQFSSWASCEAAIEGLHEKEIMPGCEHPLVVKFADAKRSDVVGTPPRRDAGIMGMMMHPPHPMMGGGYDMSSMSMAAAMGHHHPIALASMPMPGMPGLMQQQSYNGGMPIPGPMPLGYGRRGGLSSGDGASSDSLVDRASADGNDLSHPPLPSSVLPLMDNGSAGSHHSLGSSGGSMNNLQGMGMPGMAPFTPYQGMERGLGVKLGRGVSDPSVYAHKLFVGQIPFEATEQDLWPMFSPLGEILELAVLRSQGRSKGCAFLTYASPEQAASAVHNLNGRQLGPNKKLVVKYADMKKAGIAGL